MDGNGDAAAAAAAEDAVLPDELLEVCEVVLRLAISFSSTNFMCFFRALSSLSQLRIPLSYCLQHQHRCSNTIPHITILTMIHVTLIISAKKHHQQHQWHLCFGSIHFFFIQQIGANYPTSISNCYTIPDVNEKCSAGSRPARKLHKCNVSQSHLLLS
jgi:hypothetical protein